MFTHESQRESLLEDNEDKKSSENVLQDQASKTGKDGNKMNGSCHAYGSYFHLFRILSCLY